VSRENDGPDGRTFDADGRLKSRSLRAAETIDGIPCAPTREVTFHANGRLETAELAGPFASVHGILPKGTVVELDDARRIVRVTLSEPAVLATKHFSAGVAIAFPQDGPPRVD
jgi:hypothetical protein